MLFFFAVFTLAGTVPTQAASLFRHKEIKASEQHRYHRVFNPQWEKVLKAERERPFFNAQGRGFSQWDAQTWQNLLEYSRNKSQLDVLRLINGYFNHIPRKTDKELWGKNDYWASPREFMRARSGDCEDYAIAKYFALRFLGFQSRQMRVMVVINKTSGRSELHAVLAVLCNRTWFILDSNASPRDAIFPHLQYGGRLVPLYSVNEDGCWVYMGARKTVAAD